MRCVCVCVCVGGGGGAALPFNFWKPDIRAKCGKNFVKIRAKIRGESEDKFQKMKKRQKKIRVSSLEKKGKLIAFLNQ